MTRLRDPARRLHPSAVFTLPDNAGIVRDDTPGRSDSDRMGCAGEAVTARRDERCTCSSVGEQLANSLRDAGSSPATCAKEQSNDRRN